MINIISPIYPPPFVFLIGSSKACQDFISCTLLYILIIAQKIGKNVLLYCFSSFGNWTAGIGDYKEKFSSILRFMYEWILQKEVWEDWHSLLVTLFISFFFFFLTLMRNISLLVQLVLWNFIECHYENVFIFSRPLATKLPCILGTLISH